MSSIRGALLVLKYNNMIVRNMIKFTKEYLKYHFKMIIHQPSICCIVESLPFFIKLFFFLILHIDDTCVSMKRDNKKLLAGTVI